LHIALNQKNKYQFHLERPPDITDKLLVNNNKIIEIVINADNTNFQAITMQKEPNPQSYPQDNNARARARFREISLKKAVFVFVLSSIPFIALITWLNLSVQISKFNIELISLTIFYLLMAALIYYAFAKNKVRLATIFKPLNHHTHLLLVIPLIFFSIGSYWVILLICHSIEPTIADWYFNYLDSTSFLATSSKTYFYQYVILFVLVAVLVPIIEEIIFRGAFIERLAAKYSYKTALIASAIIFGLLHVDVLGAAMVGLVLGVIYLKTKSLTVPVLLHVLNNGLITLFMFLDDQFLHLPAWGETVQYYVDYAFLGILLFLIGAVPLAMYLKKNWKQALSLAQTVDTY